MYLFLLRPILFLAIVGGVSLAQAADNRSTHGRECSVPEQLKVAQGNSVIRVFNAVFLAAPAKNIDCGSIASVWQKVALREKIGGRKLEPDSPLDMNVARRQWDEAQRNPAIFARLLDVQKNTQNSMEVAIYQAAILDEEGLYTARDARILDLASGINSLVR